MKGNYSGIIRVAAGTAPSYSLKRKGDPLENGECSRFAELRGQNMGTFPGAFMEGCVPFPYSRPSGSVL